jgi:hypothetical protein
VVAAGLLAEAEVAVAMEEAAGLVAAEVDLPAVVATDDLRAAETEDPND